MIKHIVTWSGILLVMLAASCGHEQFPTASNDTAWDQRGQWPQQAVSSVNEISSAHLNIFVSYANGQPVNLHRIVEGWNPATVTWNSFGGSFSQEVEGSMPAQVSGWYSADITGLVRTWASNGQENLGILLAQPSPAPLPAVIYSSEKTGFEPFLEICCISASGSSCDTIFPSADAFIDQAMPDQNTLSSQILMIGKLMVPGADKHVLMLFDVPEIASGPEYSAVGGRVWDDLNQDGVFDVGEPGIAKVVVRLYDCMDILIAELLTGPDGAYRFDSLSGGSYFVMFEAPERYAFSPADQGSSDALDSDANPRTGRTACFLIGEGEASLHWDAGVYVPSDSESNPGCTNSRAWWRRHAGFGHHQDKVSPLLPIWLGTPGKPGSIFVVSAAEAFRILSIQACRTPSNGIGRLYAQLLATRLNMAAGADDGDIADVAAEADGFLANHDCSCWRQLGKKDRKLVDHWTRTLRLYNLGVIGPGRCKEKTGTFAAVK